MNRSILIVICDFLLVSLLLFSTVDINKAGQQSAPRMKLEIATNQVPDNIRDLTSVMERALEEERKNRDQSHDAAIGRRISTVRPPPGRSISETAP